MSIFRETEACFSEKPFVEHTITFIELNQNSFKSVGYEALSMCIATKCLQNSTPQWKEWNDYYAKYENCYKNQLLIGLGWAFASTNTSFDRLPIFGKDELSKIMDGAGYYYGLFRSRLTIRSAALPENIIPEKGFDVGIGRAIYYHAKGSTETLNQLLSPFKSNRLPEIWQGIGTACVFIGGYSTTYLDTLFKLTESYFKPFVKGGENAIQSRKNAGLPTDYCVLFQAKLEKHFNTTKTS